MLFPEVVQVIPTDEYKVYVYFADGKVTLFDAGDLVGVGVFKPLQDSVYFKTRCVVLNGTLAWEVSGTLDCTTCLDIDPFTLYALKEVEYCG